jgi:hypothetical protein
MTKIAGSGSGSGSTPICHGSATLLATSVNILRVGVKSTETKEYRGKMGGGGRWPGNVVDVDPYPGSGAFLAPGSGISFFS